MTLSLQVNVSLRINFNVLSTVWEEHLDSYKIGVKQCKRII